MKKLKNALGILGTFMFAVLVITPSFIVSSCSNKPDCGCGPTSDTATKYINATATIVTGWQHGSAASDRRWLLRLNTDTTLYTEWSGGRDYIHDDAWYNHRSGDTVHFEYIRKDRFFHVKTTPRLPGHGPDPQPPLVPGQYGPDPDFYNKLPK